MGIPAWARVGAKVVHVIHMPLATGKRHPLAVYPVEREIYTIRKVVMSTRFVGSLSRTLPHPSLLLEEIHNPPERYGEYLEPAFDIRHFRPLITQQDDIEAHFKALLDVPNQVDA